VCNIRDLYFSIEFSIYNSISRDYHHWRFVDFGERSPDFHQWLGRSRSSERAFTWRSGGFCKSRCGDVGATWLRVRSCELSRFGVLACREAESGEHDRCRTASFVSFTPIALELMRSWRDRELCADALWSAARRRHDHMTVAEIQTSCVVAP
jgi:hypothetical protein